MVSHLLSIECGSNYSVIVMYKESDNDALHIETLINKLLNMFSEEKHHSCHLCSGNPRNQ